MANAKQQKTPKRWSYSTGERGRNSVRAFEHPKSGRLFLMYYEPRSGGGAPLRRCVALGHRDQALAVAKADSLAAKLLLAGPPVAGELTLAALFDNYLREKTPDKSRSEQRHDHRAAALFLKAFGAGTDVRCLDGRAWEQFIRDRRSGRIRPKHVKKAKPVRDRAVQHDLRFLLAALNWATRVSTGPGEYLLDRNPFRGFTVPHEENPRRPITTDAELDQMLTVSDQVHPLFTLALLVAHETGHRIGSIRQLQWSDIDLKARTVTWREATDKMGKGSTTPLVGRALEALRDRRVIGDAWVFPSPEDAERPCSEWRMQRWFERGVKLAELPRVARRGYHSFRRRFATDHVKTAPKVLMEAGGWKDYNTILKCYQIVEPEALREAAVEREQRRLAAK